MIVHRPISVLRRLHPLLLLAFLVPQCLAQSAGTSEPETIGGTVLNSVTRDPIPGALVASPENHFAARTDSQGRFEFTLPKPGPAQSPAPETSTPPEASGVSTSFSVSSRVTTGQELVNESPRPLMLSARKPGFLETSNLSALGLARHAKEITLYLTPEAIIAGHISLPDSDTSEKIQLQLFRRVVQNGAAQWVPAGTTSSKSNGDFRFAELMEGTYKLLTRELLDRDPLNTNSRAPQSGYAPVYYPDADDFASAAPINLAPGQTAEPRLSLLKQPYYNVKIAVLNSPPAVDGMNVNVASQKGHTGPGYMLNYNPAAQKIEGELPSGIYTVEATAYGQSSMAGMMTLVVKGAPVTQARMILQPAASIVFDVEEQFSGKPPDGALMSSPGGGRSFPVHGPRRYLNVSLESADEFNSGKNGFLRPPSGPNDNVLDIQDVLPGRYWVRVWSSFGYAATVRSGSTDLLREPLLVSAGSSAISVEITMRDDTAQIAGQIEQLAAAPGAAVQGMPPAFVYCVPTPDSTGQFAEVGVQPDGTFTSMHLPPGDYRVFAFDHQQTSLEYRNPDAMKSFDGNGQLVHVSGGQTEHVTLQLSPTQE